MVLGRNMSLKTDLEIFEFKLLNLIIILKNWIWLRAKYLESQSCFLYSMVKKIVSFMLCTQIVQLRSTYTECNLEITLKWNLNNFSKKSFSIMSSICTSSLLTVYHTVWCLMMLVTRFSILTVDIVSLSPWNTYTVYWQASGILGIHIRKPLPFVVSTNGSRMMGN